MSAKSWSIFFLAVSFLGVLFALTSSAAELEEQVQIRLLEIWVKATDNKGNFVSTLNPEDFQVKIDGKVANMRCFDRMFAATPAVETVSNNVEPQEVFEQPKRRFIFFFDLLSSSSGDISYLKGEIAKFINRTFEDKDEGMIFALVPAAKLGVVQKFTNNKEQLIDVVSHMKGNPRLDLDFQQNQQQLTDLLYSGEVVEVTSLSITAEQIKQARSMARTFARDEERLGRLTLGSFKSIADYLRVSPVDGRLVLIYVGGGLPLIPGVSYYDMLNRAMENAALQGQEDYAYPDHPDFDFISEIRKTIGVLNRMNVTIYTIDSKGLLETGRNPAFSTVEATEGIDISLHDKNFQDSVVMIAKETGGLSFINSQNYAAHVTNIASDISQQYFLCASLPPAEKTGKYHKIEVKVNKPDIKVRHRLGYVD